MQGWATGSVPPAPARFSSNTGRSLGVYATVGVFLGGIVLRTLLRSIVGDAASALVILLFGAGLYYYRRQEQRKHSETLEGLRHLKTDISRAGGFSSAYGGGTGGIGSLGGRVGAEPGSRGLNNTTREELLHSSAFELGRQNRFGPQSGTIKLSRSEVDRYRQQNSQLSTSTPGAGVGFEKPSKARRRVYQGRRKKMKKT